MKQRAIIFDFDGVLADSWGLHERCWRQVVDKFDGRLEDEDIAKTLGLSSLETAKILVKKCKLKVSVKQLAKAKEEIFSERIKDLEMMPGAEEALKRLKEDFAVGVVSVRSHQDVAEALERFELTDIPGAVVCADDLGRGQSVDDLQELAAKGLNVKPEGCVVVEDARNGVLAAKRANMKVIAFDSNPKHKVDYSMADGVINSLDELVPELINQVAAS